MNESVIERAAKIIRDVAPRVPLTDRRIYALPRIESLNSDWWVWVAFSTVEPHIDRPKPGWITRGLIIINDQNFKLFLDEPHRTFWELRIGDCYRVYPEALHGVCTQEHGFNHKVSAEYTPTFFAAVLRDFPADQNPTYDEFKQQALASLETWCDAVETTKFKFY